MASATLRIRHCTSLRPRFSRAPNPHAPNFALPETLSMSTCLSLVLPSAHPLNSRITTLRSAYDTNYFRYHTPVIKLIHPFLRCIQEGVPDKDVMDRVHRALQTIEPFPIHLTNVKPFLPPSTREDYKPTFSIRPSPKDLPMLSIVQSALVAEFAKEIASAGPQMASGLIQPKSRDLTEVIDEPWEPRISLGRKAEISTEEAQRRFERGIWGTQPLMAEDEEEARRFGQEWESESRVRKVTEEEKVLRKDLEASDLGWEVDRVSILHNKNSGFKVVGEVLLGGKGVQYPPQK